MKEFPCYLYHICRKQDKYDFSRGYIGISRKPSKRWASGGYKDNPHLMYAFAKYDDIIKYVIKLGTRKECLANEKTLRPHGNIGWNLVKGGGDPPNPKGLPYCVSRLPKEKRRKDYTVSEESRRKMVESQQKHKKFHSERMCGDKNPMFGIKGKDHPSFKGYYITPEGEFENSKSVEEKFNISREAVRRRCKVGGIIMRSKWQPREQWGKTWQEIGWGFMPTINGEKENG